jgi:hypothetical protein
MQDAVSDAEGLEGGQQWRQEKIVGGRSARLLTNK